MYKIMVVDDEEEIRLGIKRKIDWNENGFEIVGDAENGREALELAERLRPDVVMTDIRMPFMDGLELAERLSRMLPSLKLVIFSGFDDFEYAQQAIRLNVMEYILKPVNAAELCAILRKIKGQLDDELARKRDVERLRRQYVESLPVLREQFLASLLEGRADLLAARDRVAQYGLSLRGKCFATALVHIPAPAAQENAGLFYEAELNTMSVVATLRDTLARYCRYESLFYGDGIAVIAAFDGDNEIDRLIDGMDAVCAAAERILSLRITVGIGGVCGSFSQLARSCGEARDALQYRLLLGTGKAIFIGDVEPGGGQQLIFDEEDERRLTGAIKLGSGKDIDEAIGDLLGRFSGGGLSPAQYQMYLMELTSALLRITRMSQLEMEDVFPEGIRLYDRLRAFESPDELRDWLTQSCTAISSRIRQERSNSARRLTERAKQYVGEHYTDGDLSVETICSHLHVSPAYFSTLFKRETGCSFVSYLTGVRMEQAARLLAFTDDKTHVIAAKTGYAEPNYFSYVFKKQFGMSPTKYRGAQMK